MPHYFFDTYDGLEVVRDFEGRNLADHFAARTEAIEDAKELISMVIYQADDVRRGEIRVRLETVCDSACTVSFADVVKGLQS